MPPIKESVRSKDLLRESTFLEHLEDLRGVLIHSLSAFLIASIGCWFFSERVFDFIVTDIPVEHLNFFAPSEAFMARMKMSFAIGAMVAFPYIAWRVWMFVTPALYDRERKRIAPLASVSTVLFYAGVVFCYLILIPVVLEFLLGFGTERLTPLLSVGAYFAMVARLCFAFGLVFQLPVIVLVLSLTGIVTPQLLLRQWRYAILIIFVTAAILTPPDPASQVLMALPVVLLYIGSVLVAHVAVRKREDDSSDEDSD